MWRCPFCGLQYEEYDFYLICPGCGQHTNMVVRSMTECFQPLVSTHAAELKRPSCFSLNPERSKECKACGVQIGSE